MSEWGISGSMGRFPENTAHYLSFFFLSLVPEDLSDTVHEPAKNSDLYTTSDRQLPNIGRRIIGGHRDKKGESFNQQVLVEDNNEVKKDDDDDDEDYDDEDYDDEERCKEILPKINCKPHSQKGFGALDTDHQKLQASVREKIHCQTEPRHFSDVPEDLGDTDNEPAKNSDLYTTSDRQLPNIGRVVWCSDGMCPSVMIGLILFLRLLSSEGLL
ncbi:hypothetical protein FKM82_002134 [Ascaphus truei]